MTYKTYIENSYIREIYANIVECNKVEDKYYIKLDRTIFYPHLSGGQPKDKGTINNIFVEDVYEDESGDIIHVLKEPISHKDKVLLKIDWENRLDLMQQHTGQHILSAVIYNLYQADTESFHFGEDYVSIVITKDELSKSEIKQIEYLTNHIIQSNKKISSYYPNEKELKMLPLRKDIIDTGDNIRIVEIDGLDISCCCGTHLNSTGELGLIKIRRIDKTKGKIRIDFVCGNRALKDYSWKNDAVYKIGDLLSSKGEDIVHKTKQLLDIKLSLEKEIIQLRKDLARSNAQIYLSQSKVIGNYKYIYKNLNSMDMKYANLIVNYLKDEESLVQIYTIENDNKLSFNISISKNINKNLSNLLNDLKMSITIRGGGSSHNIQGTIDIKDIDVFLNFFKENLI